MATSLLSDSEKDIYSFKDHFYSEAELRAKKLKKLDNV